MALSLVIAHYHLNRGGVTQVIVNQLRALARTSSLGEEIRDITLLYGGRHQGWPDPFPEPLPVPLQICDWPELEYDSHPPSSRDSLAGEVQRRLAQLKRSPDQTLLHLHNHALGKNIGWTAAVPQLAQAGYRTLLQIHDFAEDFRPANYQALLSGIANGRSEELPPQLYPQAEHIHYAVLNGRDRAILADAGTNPRNLHYLPNPVSGPGQLPKRESARQMLADRVALDPQSRFVLYPVRGIRRKNIGELLIWSVLAQETRFGVTLAPLNVLEQPSYERWKALSASLQLPVHFELGERGGCSLQENLAAADALITTSVAEGFGMVFLECWLSGSPLIGRDLPDITSDFRQQGLQFDGLTKRLAIPADWIPDWSGFCRRWADAVNHVLQNYQQPQLSPAEVDRTWQRLTQNATIDFAHLDSEHQAKIVRQIHDSPQRRDELLQRNPELAESLATHRDTAADQVRCQASRVAQEYSLEISGERLLELYRTVARSPQTDVGALPHAEVILQRYLDPMRLHLIRLET